MAVKTALLGKVLIGSDQIGHLTNAALKLTGAVGDLTAIGDSWKSEIPLLNSWTLTVQYVYDSTDAGQSDLRTAWISGSRALASLQMWEDGTHYFSGAGNIADLSYTKAQGAEDKISVTINGSGSLQYT
jgi:Phage tail tube protein